MLRKHTSVGRDKWDKLHTRGNPKARNLWSQAAPLEDLSFEVACLCVDTTHAPTWLLFCVPWCFILKPFFHLRFITKKYGRLVIRVINQYIIRLLIWLFIYIRFYINQLNYYLVYIFQAYFWQIIFERVPWFF